MLKEMKRIQPEMVLLGSPWSPPGWMQLDGVIMGSETNNSLDHRYADAFARYFVKYIEAYEKAGAHVDAITLQNEPLANKAGMPSMYIGANESAYLIRNHVGPMLRKAGLDTEIWAFDHNTGKSLVHSVVENPNFLTFQPR
jgi:glucosylceramidase